ncbi:MAG: SDR family oxidoreductase [Actinobacteria bacterium]|nr:SDR family oxidoreductase [Actinomycetota bacterium]
MTSMRGKLAVVTGGTRGLGAAITTEFCRRGAHVLANHVSLSDGEIRRQVEDLPGSVSTVRADIATPDGVEALLAAVEGERVDYFVHNAAVFHPMSALSPDADDFQRTMAVTLGPFLHGIDRLAKLMPAGGRVVAISSNGALATVPHYLATGVAKAALESLMRYLAVELAPRGIAVNVVRTALLDKGQDTGNPQLRDLLAARTPGGHLTLPSDVAEAVALLCQPEAHWLQGQTVLVDGGLGLRG